MAMIHKKPVTQFLVVSILLFAIVDFAIAPIIRWISDPHGLLVLIFYLCLGVIGAQIGLLAAWFVFAPVKPAKRFAMGTGMGLLFFVVWACGFSLLFFSRPYYGSYWRELKVISLSLPLVIIAIQTPLWAMRIWCRWHVVHVTQCTGQSTYKALGIRDILIATGVMAMALSAAQMAVPDGGSNSTARLLLHLTGAGVALVASLVTILPALAATLHTWRPWRAIICTLFLQIAILVGVALFVHPPLEAILYLAFMVFGFAATTYSVLLAARELGYRLLWGRKATVWNEPSTVASSVRFTLDP